jgi:hypothetical protein
MQSSTLLVHRLAAKPDDRGVHDPLACIFDSKDIQD